MPQACEHRHLEPSGQGLTSSISPWTVPASARKARGHPFTSLPASAPHSVSRQNHTLSPVGRRMRTCRTTTSRDQKSSKSHSRGGWTLTYFRGNHPDLEPHGEEVGGGRGIHTPCLLQTLGRPDVPPPRLHQQLSVQVSPEKERHPECDRRSKPEDLKEAVWCANWD